MSFIPVFSCARTDYYKEEVTCLVQTVQRTILFLIADTGAGHRSAANAISSAITLISQREQEAWQARAAATTVHARAATEPASQVEAAAATVSVKTPALPPPDYRLEIVDVFDRYSRFPLREAVKLYGPTIRHNPRLFGEVFHKSNKEETVMAVKALTAPLVLNGLMKLITSVQPDVIVSIHPMLNHITIQALAKLDLHVPFLTVVTDLVSVHYSWFAPGVDAYIVPTEQAKQLYLKRGLDPKRVYMLGMPIHPKFIQITESREQLRRKLQLKPGVPAVLLVGGGDGAGGLYAAVRAISQARLPVQLLVVTGRNRRLYARLQRTRSNLNVPATIFGFVQNMPELMHASDLIVTKAGPGTICEALACDLPIVLSGYVPGQEEGNIEFVVNNHVGSLALEPRVLVETIKKLINPNSNELREQQEQARRLSRPRSSFDIGACILSFMPPCDQPGIWQSEDWLQRQPRVTSRLRNARRLRLSSRPPRRLSLPRLRTTGTARGRSERGSIRSVPQKRP